jgi:4'-phosphopantetheinyl transferase
VLTPPPRIEEPCVHVWTAYLECEPAVLQRLETTLSPDERARAARFVFPRDRDHFIAGRGILRNIVAQYTRQPAVDLAFTYQAEGKPRLRLRESDPDLRFNVSHSHGVAVYALACDREVGIDVEAVRSDVAAEDIAARFFSAIELAEFRELPFEHRDEGFFLCWTRKEAYVKALGGGLSIPLDSFSVSLTPGMSETLVSADRERWTLRSFRPAAGYVGAVVAEGKDWTLHCRNWPSEAR